MANTGSSSLEALRARTIEAYARGDAEAATSLYVEDGVQQPPGRPAAVGAYRLVAGDGEWRYVWSTVTPD